MAVQISEISTWLDSLEINYKVLEDKDGIFFGISNESTKKQVFVELEEDGEVFQMYMNLLDDELDVVKIKGHQHAGLILEHMLKLNYSTKFGTWEFDPSDGEMRLAVEIPLEDALMTEKQFKRILGYFTRDGQNGFEDIIKIMQTGEIPSREAETAAMLLQMLEELQAGLNKVSKEEDPIGI